MLNLLCLYIKSLMRFQKILWQCSFGCKKSTGFYMKHWNSKTVITLGQRERERNHRVETSACGKGSQSLKKVKIGSHSRFSSQRAQCQKLGEHVHFLMTYRVSNPNKESKYKMKMYTNGLENFKFDDSTIQS